MNNSEVYAATKRSPRTRSAGSTDASDILAGMDDEVRDGVDMLSLSLAAFPIPLFEDSITIRSFRATVHELTAAKSTNT